MANDRADPELPEELLAALRAGDAGEEGEEVPPARLAERAIGLARAEITARDLIDLTTMVFVLRFCVPLLDLVAGLFGAGAEQANGGNDGESVR